MNTHDPLCPRAYYDEPDVVVCLCPEFSAVRQDESVKATARICADLIAKVEALAEDPLDEDECDCDWVRACEWGPALTAVLAILRGKE